MSTAIGQASQSRTVDPCPHPPPSNQKSSQVKSSFISPRVCFLLWAIVGEAQSPFHRHRHLQQPAQSHSKAVCLCLPAAFLCLSVCSLSFRPSMSEHVHSLSPLLSLSSLSLSVSLSWHFPLLPTSTITVECTRRQIGPVYSLEEESLPPALLTRRADGWGAHTPPAESSWSLASSRAAMAGWFLLLARVKAVFPSNLPCATMRGSAPPASRARTQASLPTTATLFICVAE